MPEYIGRQIGNYRITRLLGEGGFAQVYLGEHIYLQTAAAIKVLLANLAERDLQAFLNEARVIARLRHPHVVRVLEFGIDNEHVPFLIMTYAPYGTLRQRHPKGSMVPPQHFVSYVKQVAAALQYAHDQKIIHRDVKSENMLLGRNNEVLLSDFGIAVAARNTISQDKEDIGGTVIYMAPEQLRGRPRPASDQYALGVVVYEWLSGARPFDGSGFLQMAAHHLLTPPLPLRERVPQLSRDIEEVVMKTLAKEPAERFPNVESFARALEEACITRNPLYTSYPHAPFAPLPSVSSTVDPPTQTVASVVDPSAPTALTAPDSAGALPSIRLQDRLSRRTVATALAGIVGLSAISGGIAWFALTHTAPPSAAPTVTAPPPTLLPSRPLGTTLITYSKHTDKVTGITWSPDGSWVASSSDDRTVHVWSPTAGTTTDSLIYSGHTGKVLAVAWSPNRTYIASTSEDKTVRVWYAPSTGNHTPGSTLLVYQGSSTDVPALAWSPDSKRIASTNDAQKTGGTEMQVWDAGTGKHTIYYPDPTQNGPGPTRGPDGAVAWSPNGLYIASSINTVSVWNVADGSRFMYNGHQFTVVHGLAWSPDSKRIASAGDDKTVQVWDAATGNSLFTYKGHTAAVNAVAWSPDGTYLASASSDTTVQVWDAATGKAVFTYRGHTAPVNAVAWYADSRHIASGGDDKRVLVWQGV